MPMPMDERFEADGVGGPTAADEAAATTAPAVAVHESPSKKPQEPPWLQEAESFVIETSSEDVKPILQQHFEAQRQRQQAEEEEAERRRQEEEEAAECKRKAEEAKAEAEAEAKLAKLRRAAQQPSTDVDGGSGAGKSTAVHHVKKALAFVSFADDGEPTTIGRSRLSTPGGTSIETWTRVGVFPGAIGLLVTLLLHTVGSLAYDLGTRAIGHGDETPLLVVLSKQFWRLSALFLGAIAGCNLFAPRLASLAERSEGAEHAELLRTFSLTAARAQGFSLWGAAVCVAGAMAADRLAEG